MKFLSNSEIKFSLLGIIKISFSPNGMPAWVILLIVASMMLVNVLLFSAIAFWCIGTLFQYHIDFSIVNVIAASLLWILFKGND